MPKFKTTNFNPNDFYTNTPYFVPWDFDPETLPAPENGMKYVKFQVESMNGDHDEKCLFGLFNWD